MKRISPCAPCPPVNDWTAPEPICLGVGKRSCRSMSVSSRDVSLARKRPRGENNKRKLRKRAGPGRRDELLSSWLSHLTRVVGIIGGTPRNAAPCRGKGDRPGSSCHLWSTCQLKACTRYLGSTDLCPHWRWSLGAKALAGYPGGKYLGGPLAAAEPLGRWLEPLDRGL
jgi:hypothetical protein